MALQSVLLPVALLVLARFDVGVGLTQAHDVSGPVPTPTAIATVEISVGNSYPFPWSGVTTCQRPWEPGCFVVKAIGPGQAVLAYTRVELQGPALKPQGFRYVTPVTADGSGYELFTVKHGGGREEWVYAVLERAEHQRARMRFLKLPAYVTERARLAVAITIDGARQRLEERYAVQAEEPLTLIGLGRVDAAYPGARLDAIEINRQRLTLPLQEIVHLNLPAGEHEIRILVGLGASPGDLTIQGTLLEPRRMSLIQGLDLYVAPEPGARSREVEVQTVGLPSEIWERFKSTLLVAPIPTREVSVPLAVRYRFATNEAIALRARPRIQVGPNNYPVMIRITEERAAPFSR